MEISELGERGMIKRIWEIMGEMNEDEDVHFLDNGDKYLLLAMDSINEGYHFFRDWGPSLIGEYILKINLSDIASKNGKPEVFMSSMSFPRDLEVEYVDRLVEGIKKSCIKYGVTFAGGDLKESRFISLTGLAIGAVNKGKEYRRKGAKPGDFVYITNKIGKQEKAIMEFHSGKGKGEEILSFEPKLKELTRMSGYNITSCLDNSDGVYKSLYLLASINRVKMLIENNVSISEEEEFRKVIYSLGGDFELIFTSPDSITEFPRIGRVEEGNGVIDLDGTQPDSKGYDHFSISLGKLR